jgi:hypothetical protein
MAYRMEEYLVCVVAALGFGTLLLAGSLLVMLAREGFAHAFQVLRRAANATFQVSSAFGGRDLEARRSPSMVLAGTRPRIAAETSSDLAA